MNAQDIVAFIGNVGFPAFVATFLLLRLDNTLRKNRECQERLIHRVDHLIGVIGAKWGT